MGYRLIGTERTDFEVQKALLNLEKESRRFGGIGLVGGIYLLAATNLFRASLDLASEEMAEDSNQSHPLN